MNNNTTFIFIDAVGRTYEVDPAQVPTRQAMKFEIGPKFRFVDGLWEEVNQGLFTFRDRNGIEVTDDNWGRVLDESIQIQMFMDQPQGAIQPEVIVMEGQCVLWDRSSSQILQVLGKPTPKDCIGFTDIWGRRTVLLKAVLNSDESYRLYAAAIFRRIEPLPTLIEGGAFVFETLKEMQDVHTVREIGMKIRDSVLEELGTRAQTLIYPGRGDIVWYTRSQCTRGTEPQMLPAMKAMAC